MMTSVDKYWYIAIQDVSAKSKKLKAIKGCLHKLTNKVVLKFNRKTSENPTDTGINSESPKFTFCKLLWLGRGIGKKKGINFTRTDLFPQTLWGW